jgi:hypothetical protein
LFILFALLLWGGPERDDADVDASFGVDQRQQSSVNDCCGKIHPPAFVLVARFIGAFVRVFVDQMSVFEVESELLQIGLSLCLILDELDLIVATT